MKNFPGESTGKYFTCFDTPLCKMLIAGNKKGISRLHFCMDESPPFSFSPDWEENNAFFTNPVEQIRQYLSGSLKEFRLTLNPQGTLFQKKVWKALTGIPYGKLSSYGKIAEAIGNKNGARAVGSANSRNPVPLIIPCHRVIASDGSISGFAYGQKIKKRLIRLEKEGHL